MSISTELAKRIACLHYAGLPDIAVQAAKNAILDTLGVTLAGSRDPSTTIVKRVLGPRSASGTSLIFGDKDRTNCLDAALINGTAAHALDFDDYSDTLGGHPSAPILPAVLALGEEINANGRDLLLAYIAGFETETRLGRAVNLHHYEKGWHPTATLGVFGAAAACARLLELSEEQVASALSLSVSLASGVKANFGSMTKPFHVGHCARNGLLATLLARDGFTANHDAFEHKQGFFNVFNGPGTFNAGMIFINWANPLEIISPGAEIKQYPCCASIHPAINAVIQIARDHDVAPQSVSTINAKIHARRLLHTNNPDPQNYLEAKFSLQYCVARALTDRGITLEHFEGSALQEPAVRRLMRRVQVSELRPSDSAAAIVDVVLEDGRTYSLEANSSIAPLPESEIMAGLLQSKFSDCARKVLPSPQVVKLQETVGRLEEISNVREVTSIIATIHM